MTNTMIDQYLREVVGRHSPILILGSEYYIGQVEPHIREWANGHAFELQVAGSLAKNTGISGTTDIDIFISLHPSVSTIPINTLEYVYTTLRNRLTQAGYSTREQNVSLGISHASVSIDVVPGVRHHAIGHDHSLWKRKAGSWTKTNVAEHIRLVRDSGRTFDIRMIKIWRKCHAIDLPSFYLELSVLQALRNLALDAPSDHFIKVMQYLANDFVAATIYDPANTNNCISEELTVEEKRAVAQAALATLVLTDWSHAIW